MKILLSILLFFFVTFAYSGELEERNKISEHVKELFLKGDYEALSSLARTYKDSEERTSSGRWKLHLVHIGIFDLINTDIKDKEYWDVLEKKFLDWTNKQPNEPISHISYSSFLYLKGWMYRGHSYAKNVPTENWKLFKTQIQKATKYLIKYKDVASKDPHWYAQMIGLARTNGTNKILFNTLVNEALKKYPNYYSIYKSALYYMHPSWNNFSKEEIENFAQKLIDANPNDTSGIYARFYWMAHGIIYKNDSLFFDSNIDWIKMSKSMDELIQTYPTQYNINHLAYISCLSGDYKKTQSLIKKIVGSPMTFVWKSQENYNRCKEASNDTSQDNANNQSFKTISPNELTSYIQSSSSDKMQIFYFSSYPENCKICDINSFNKLAQEYTGKADFISVNLFPESSIYKYPNIFYSYYINSTPSMMLVYNKKIIRRIFSVKLLTEYSKYKKKIDSTLKELTQPGFLTMFKETISDKASYLNSNDEIRHFDSLFMPSEDSMGARACAVSLYKDRIAWDQKFSFNSQEEANEKALEGCEKERARYEIKDECKLHKIGKKYVYETDIPSSKNEQSSSYFKIISSTNIKEYVINTSSKKPQYIYFKRKYQNISKPLMNLAQQFQKSIAFLEVNIETADNNFEQELKDYFGLKLLPSSVLVYQNKIIFIHDENHIDKFWINSLKSRLNNFIDNLHDQKSFEQYPEGIYGSNIRAYNAKLRTQLDVEDYLRLKNSKVSFVAIGDEYSVNGLAHSFDNIKDALYQSYVNCRMNKVGYKIYSDCELYMLDNKYVYGEQTAIEKEIKKMKTYFNSDLKSVKSISIKQIDEYTDHKKPLLIYFGKNEEALEELDLMAKFYKNKIDFVTIDIDTESLKNYSDYENVKKKYGIKYHRHIVIIFKGKTLLSETIGTLSHNGNHSREVLNKKLKKLLSPVKIPEKIVKVSQKNKNTVNVLTEVNDLKKYKYSSPYKLETAKQKYEKAKNYKAWAITVDGKHRIYHALSMGEVSQEIANQKALEECNLNMAAYERFGEAFDECVLYKEGDKNVYEQKISLKSPSSNFFYTLPVDEIKKYAKENSVDKPVFVYFPNLRSNVTIDKQFNSIAKDFRNKIDFIKVEDGEALLNSELKHYYSLKRTPAFALVYKNKIVMKNDRTDAFKHDFKSIRLQLHQLFKKKSQENLEIYGEGIYDNLYYAFNAHLTTKTNTTRYLGLDGHKAWAVAIGKKDSIGNWSFGQSNPEEAKKKALIKCEDDKKNRNIEEECTIYMFENSYVYDQDITLKNIVQENKTKALSKPNFIKQISANEIEDYIDNSDNNSIPLLVYFDYFDSRLSEQKISKGLEKIAKSFGNDFNIVTVHSEYHNRDPLNRSIKKRFNMREYPCTVIIHNNKVVYNKGGNLNNNYSRKILHKDLINHLP